MKTRPEYLIESTKKLENAGSRFFKKLDIRTLVQDIDDMSRLPNLKKEEIDKLYRNIDLLASIMATFKHYIDLLMSYQIKIDKNGVLSISICQLQMGYIIERLTVLKAEIASIDYHTAVLADARSTPVEVGVSKEYLDKIAKSPLSYLLVTKEDLTRSAQECKKMKLIETSVDSLNESFCSFIFAVLEPLHGCFDRLIRYSDLMDPYVDIRPKLKKCQTLIDLAVVENNARNWKQEHEEFCLHAQTALVFLVDVQAWIITIKNKAKLLFLPDNKHFNRDVLKLEEFEPDTKQYNPEADLFYNMMKLDAIMSTSKHAIVQTHDSSIKSATDLLERINTLQADIAAFVRRTRSFPSGALEDAKRHYADGKKIKHCIDAHSQVSLKNIIYNLTMAKVDCQKSQDLQDKDSKLIEISGLLARLAVIQSIIPGSDLALAVDQFLIARSEFKKQYPDAGKKAPLYRFFSQATTPSLSTALAQGAQTARDQLSDKRPARAASDTISSSSGEAPKHLRKLPREAQFKSQSPTGRDKMSPRR
jgi:hypothetical protein